MRSRFTTRRENRSFLGQLDRSLPAPHTRRTSSTGIAYSGGLRSAMTAGHTLKPFIASRHRPDASARVRRDECMPGPPRTREGEVPVYREIFVPVDNSTHSDWAVDRAIELSRRSDGRVTGNHVYAARLHDVRFRQLETGLPARFQTPAEIKKQRKIHDKLIEKGLQLIADSFLDQLGKRCEAAGVRLTRQLLEGINYEEIVNEVNRGAGRLPGLIGFDPDRAAGYDGGEKVRSDVKVGENGRLIAEDDDAAARLAGSSGREYDLLAIGAHGLGRQPYSQLGGVVSRVLRGVEKDVLIVRDDRPFAGGRFLVCVDGSSYGYRAMRVALELAQAFGGSLYVCSAFDVEYHHVVFHNIKDVLSYQASKVFKFEEQEELHNNIIDKGLLKLCQANLKRAEVMAREFPAVPLQTQILIGKPFQVIMQWAEEIKPSLLVLARHGAHRIEGTQLGSQAENLVRLATCNVLVAGTSGIRPEDIPWIEEDGVAGLEWAPEAEVRILRVPPFAQGIARRAVEEYVLEQTHGEPATVTNRWLDEAIKKLLPTHMQLIMGIGTADEFAVDTMMVMFSELRAKQIRGEANGLQAFIEEAKAQGITRCPIRDIEEKMGKCPVDLKTLKPEEARAAMERLLAEQTGD